MSSIRSLGGTVALALLVMAESLGLTEAQRDFSNVQSGTTQVVDGSSTPLLIETDEPTDTTPVGLAIEVENGAGIPLRLRQGQRFFINQVDIRSFVMTSVDQGIDAITESGDFASLDWSGLELDESEPLLLPNPDGTFTTRSFYRGATWMNRRSFVRIWQVDADGQRTSPTLNLDVGTSSRLGDADSFFIRRMRGIQWALDCPAINDCTGATNFREEALVELRNSRQPNRSFELHPSTVALRVEWTAHGVDREPYEVLVEQISDPDYAYGFDIELAALTPPGPGGVYAPGTDIEFQLTLTDGSGARLHPQGSLPSYADVVFGVEQSGIQYYRAFFDESATYWRRKHRERMLMAQIIGPNQAVQPIYSIAPLEVFLDPEDSEVVATPAVDGVYAEFTLLPPANVIFLGAFTPGNPQWFAPNVDTFTFHLPEDAEPGTYKVTIKGRRVYLGEDIPHTTSIEIQVGTGVQTTPMLTTGPCNTCHSGGGDLGLILHANDDRSACAGCHVPLAFELEGPIATRVHFIHSRSGRFDESLAACATCHLNELSIQRTSKHACMSCHTEYPDTHVEWFGAIESIYIGGGPESFAQCTDSCHTTHPGSGF